MQESIWPVDGADGINLKLTLYEAESSPSTGPLRSVILLHGWPNAGRTGRTFADANWHVIALDLRVFGDSAKPQDGYDISTRATDVAAVAQMLLPCSGASGSRIGHSMGGKIAQVVASRQPAGLESAI